MQNELSSQFELKQAWLMNYKQLFHADLWKPLGAVFWADEWQMTVTGHQERLEKLVWRQKSIFTEATKTMGTWHETEEDLAMLLWSNKLCERTIATCINMVEYLEISNRPSLLLETTELSEPINWAANVTWLITLETRENEVMTTLIRGVTCKHFYSELEHHLTW